MSFSAHVKEELSGHISTSRHCRLAELGAILYFTGYYNKEVLPKDAFDKTVYKKCEKLIRLLDIDVNSEEGKRALKIIYDKNGYSVDNILVERNCCKQAFFRGAFLAAGSITDPEKGYHFEIVCDSKQHTVLLTDIMEDFMLEPKVVSRKHYYVVYIKDGSLIVDALNVMGAHISLMNMENVRILKDIRNSVNRRVNCETANINKTVSAAVRQIDDIRFIEQEAGLKCLPDNLRILAEIRLEEPELPLKELGEKLTPKLGKSGVNHRLRKISEIANELRRK